MLTSEDNNAQSNFDEELYRLLNDDAQPNDGVVFSDRHMQDEGKKPLAFAPAAARPYTPIQIVDDIGLPIPVPPPCRTQDWGRDLLTYFNDSLAPNRRCLIVVYQGEHAMLPDGRFRANSPAASFMVSMFEKYHHIRMPHVQPVANPEDYLKEMKRVLDSTSSQQKYPWCIVPVSNGTPRINNLVSAIATMQDPTNEWTTSRLADTRFVLFVHYDQMFPSNIQFPEKMWSVMYVENSSGKLYSYKGRQVVWDHRRHCWGWPEKTLS
jgi:hypothetical protein